MDPEYQNEQFITLRIKASVVKDFRTFCKAQETSHSVTLRHMLDFFERNHLTPCDSIPNDLGKIEKRLLNRLNAIIGVLRAIEQKHTKPTVEMLQSLFDAELQANINTETGRIPTWDSKILEDELRRFEQSGGTY